VRAAPAAWALGGGGAAGAAAAAEAEAARSGVDVATARRVYAFLARR
jgi:hypothetical protein